VNRRNTKKRPPPRMHAPLLAVIERLESRAMLAGVGPESWSAPGLAAAPLGTGSLFSSGIILTCSSPTPGSSGTASPPAPTSGSGGTTSGGDLWDSYSTGSGAGGSTSGSTGGVSTNGPAPSSQYNGGSGVGQGSGTVGTLTNAELWRLYWSGAGAGSSSGPANGSLASDPTLAEKYASGSGGGMVFFVAGTTGADAASSGSQQVSSGSTTLTLADGQSPVMTTPLVYQPGSDDGPGVVSAEWTGDDGGWQVVQAGDTGRTQRGVGTTAGDWLDRNFGGGTFGEPDLSGRVWARFRGLFSVAPIAGEISDSAETITGVGPNGEKLTPGQRGATAVGALLPIVPGTVARKALRPITDKIDDAIEFMGDAGKAAGKNADSVDGAGRVAGDVADTGGQTAGRGGPYGHLGDGPTVGSAKPFTPAQKRKILEENRTSNGGVLKDDVTGEIGQAPSQHKKGVTPPGNEVNIDHYYPKSEGGPNTFSNAEVRLRKNNLEKSDTIPGE